MRERVGHGSQRKRKCDEEEMVAASNATEKSCNVRTEGYPCAWQLVNVKSAVTMQKLQQFLGFPGGASGKEPACQYGRL